MAAIAARREARPAQIAYPAELPITGRRMELLDTIAHHQVVVVAGETGSGKSTQLPKLCLELGRGVDGMIGHTQPRRIAARSIAERVAAELGTELGDAVGYTVRFTDRIGEGTLIRLMTDGILLNEIQRDPELRRYDTIILDEAHERALNIDFLLGYLKQLLPSRPDLKLIITSATIDTERFAAHFDDAPVVQVAGRTYPVEIRYRPLDGDDGMLDQTEGICAAVEELFTEGDGDVLVFCSGEREIRDAVDAIEEMGLAHTEVVPLYGRLSAQEQHRVFAPHRGRRVVVATNVAETSLTVPGVRYVVDTGLVRMSRYNRRTKVQRLPIEPVSRASADQRAGRCGRLGPGVAIRLYAETDYLSRPEFTEPEILRTNLASVILQMAALRLGDIEGFPFLDPPDTRSIRDGIGLLEELRAVDAARLGTDRWLTKLGRRLARLPLDPRLGRMVLEADRYACLREVLVIAAAMAIQDPRERPRGQEQQADALHRRFAHPDSDFLSWLALWEYVRSEQKQRTSSQFRRMCRDEFLHYRRIREWQDVHTQLREITREMGLGRNHEPADPESIHRALVPGLLSQVGMKDPDSHEYRGARGSRFSLSPASTLFKAKPAWVMAAELVETTRTWAHAAARIDPRWAEQAGEHLLKRSYSDAWWDAERGAAMAYESVTLFGLPLVNDRVVHYERIDPAAARRLFIEHALVAGEWNGHHPFVAHNATRINEVLELEARGRRSDLLVDDEAVVAFFESRIPDSVTSVVEFEKWWKDARHDHPELLHLRVDDLIDPAAEPVDESAFPRVWSYGDLELPLTYHYDPAAETDGVTVDVPLAGLDLLDPTEFEGHVPGLRRELVTHLVRSLPKQVRKQLVPIPDTVDEMLARIDQTEHGLVEALRREITRRTGAALLPGAFDLSALPPHLRLHFRVVDDTGNLVAEGSDLAALRRALRRRARDAIETAGHPLERTGLRSWDFDALPQRVGLGGSATAYPALVDEGGSVAIRLLATETEQDRSHWEGLRRLLLLALPAPGRLLRPLLDNELKLAMTSSPHTGPDDWAQDVQAAAVGELMVAGDAPVWDRPGFEALLAVVRDRVGPLTERLGRESAELLRTLHRVRVLLEGPLGERFGDVAADITAQLGRFIYPGFLAGVGAGRVADVGRYLLAAERRLQRLPERADRDRQAMAAVRTLEARLDELMDQLPWTQEMNDIAWTLQELRVSLFAQQLGVRGQVSEKRIAAALDRLVGLA